MARTIAIGDIHGCSLALETLLNTIQPEKSDRIITLGDYIDRGPDSCAVLDRLLALSNECETVFLLGNHEAMLLDAYQTEFNYSHWLYCGGDATLQSYGGSLDGIPPEHLHFVRKCQFSYETDKHFFVHANYVYDEPLHNQPNDVLLWEHLSADPPPPHQSGKTAIVGHTPQGSGAILDAGHLVCIDTCCFGGGYLTAYDIDTQQIWQADIQGTLRKA
ncbi:metallophosphoesterase family protein [Lignipirellula cremea]|uniref:metallophosphoesterase family protein n=1 Tax=Lignipirellula cremea TaxID=2528010 RepID=UPI0018D2522F|nr:metallophosphoesterase family protein [Lignipirellula cremea]